jgi:mRNA-degrading endonuclease RelE of RelBE toxin-antitoxin system
MNATSFSTSIWLRPKACIGKYRVGDYRVIYAVLGNEVLVLRIGHRKDIYKKGL